MVLEILRYILLILLVWGVSASAENPPFDEAHRAAARENYKFYKERGYVLEYHKMQGNKNRQT